MRILVVAAHPDDEVLGCGGTITRLSQEGHEISIAIVGEGISSRSLRRDEADPAQMSQLHSQSREAANKMGVRDLISYKLPDNRLDTMPLLDLTKMMEQLVDQIKPQVVYTHHPGDLNVDHGIVHRAVLTATRPLAGSPLREVYAFEVPSSTEWAFQALQPCFRPNVFVDVAGTLETKIAAMSCYEKETRPFPHPRSPEALRAIAMRWGSVIGCHAAEAFELVRSFRPAELQP